MASLHSTSASKKNKDVRRYRCLNKTNPKHNFTFSYIEVLRDNTEGHAFFSHGRFLKYNLILIALEGKEKHQ